MKYFLLMTLILLTLILTACGTASSGPQAGSGTSADSLPIATQLLIGTMKLDGMEQDVTAEKAAELLPLWQVYSELLTSDIAAQEEIDGLVEQIQETMTDKQMQVIEDMALTQQDVIAAMQESGGGMNQASQSRSSSSSGSSSGGFAPPDGGMAMGAPPDGGEMVGGVPIAGQSSSGGDSSTTEAVQGPMGGGVPSALIDALIELLQSKANS